MGREVRRVVLLPLHRLTRLAAQKFVGRYVARKCCPQAGVAAELGDIFVHGQPEALSLQVFANLGLNAVATVVDVNPQTRVRQPSHHLVRVMRLVAGDEIAVFDGEGHEFQARVVRADRKGAVVAIGQPIRSAPEPAVAAVLVQAVLKGDKMDAVVRDATMAGVARVVPVITERSVVGLSALARGHAHERWQRIAVASAKQCRRARLPAIDAPRPLSEWLEVPFDGRRLLLVEP